MSSKDKLLKDDFLLLDKKDERKSKTKSANSKSAASIGLEHQLSVNEIELKRQNEELLATQKKLREALKESEEMFEFSPSGFFILNIDGVIEKANAGATIMLGYDKIDFLKKPFSLFLYCDECKANFIRHRNSVVETGKQHRFEGKIKKKDGSYFIGLVKSTCIKDENNEFKHLLCTVADITKVREHEILIEESLKHTKELSDMKSKFVALASHEFRTPLSAVLTSTSLVEKYVNAGDYEKVNKHLTRIKSSVKDLTSILEDFLSLEKLENGKIDVTRKQMNLPDFCEDILDDARANLKDGQIINYHHTGGLEIIEDRKILQHILHNLLTNASKYSGQNKMIELYSEVKNGIIRLKVIDNGIGIPEDEQEKVFTRFFRAQNTENIQGTGLGLSITKRYVELISGTIIFTSKSNEGTTFIVEIPLN